MSECEADDGVGSPKVVKVDGESVGEMETGKQWMHIIVEPRKALETPTVAPARMVSISTNAASCD